MAKKTQIQKVETKAPAFNIETLINQAVSTNASVESLERLLALRKQLKDEWAKEQYIMALVAFKAQCPRIEKTRPVYEKDRKTIRYKFAPLEDIDEQIKKPLADNGLNYNFNPVNKDNMIGVSCTITHINGHSTTSDPFFLPVGSEQFMSEVQKFGARMTFAKRYVLLMALGINTADEDIDAKEEKEIDTVGIDETDIQMINASTTQESLLRICGDLKKKYPNKLKTLLDLYTIRKTELETAEVEDINEKAAKELN